MTDLIEHLKKLDEKRTQGEWFYDEKSAHLLSSIPDEVTYAPVAQMRARAMFFDDTQHDAAFITTLANEALPALEAMKAEIERLREALGEHQKQHEMMMDMASRVLDGSPVYSVHKDTKKKTRRKFADVVFEEAKCAAKHAHATLEGGK